jgi:hypothetical protein
MDNSIVLYSSAALDLWYAAAEWFHYLSTLQSNCIRMEAQNYYHVSVLNRFLIGPTREMFTGVKDELDQSMMQACMNSLSNYFKNSCFHGHGHRQVLPLFGKDLTRNSNHVPKGAGQMHI